MIYAENILLCIAIPLIIAAVFGRGNSRRFIVSFLIGMVSCLLAAYISGFINAARQMSSKETAIFISPMIEEVMKMLPLVFYLFMFEPGDNDLMMTAIGIGAGFATYENCCYILTEGAEKISYIIIRGMAVGVMHIVSIIAFVIGLTMARRFKLMSVGCIVGALSLSMTFHGLYNLLVSEAGITSYIGYALPIITAILLYVPYRRNGKTGSAEV